MNSRQEDNSGAHGESASLRTILAITEQPDNLPKLNDLRQRIANANKASDKRIAATRQHINQRILDRLNFNDSTPLGKTELQRIFELLGEKGEVTAERFALRDAYDEALDAYRLQA
jgi:hypothetical protein